MALDADRRAQLERSRAVALLRDHFDADTSGVAGGAPFGVTVLSDKRAWIVSMSADLAALGGVLAWLDRHRVTEAQWIVEDHGAVHARRVSVLAPELRVWTSRGSTVEPAIAAPLPTARPRPEFRPDLESLLVAEGLEIVCENGIIRGELAGLEVARIVDGPDGPVLEAGVGRFDREAGALLHGGRSMSDSLRDAVRQVRPHRQHGSVSHAVNRLARERWLRHLVMQDPQSAGVVAPELVEPIPPRPNLLDAAPASLVGSDGDSRVLVMCSVGVDLGLVPAAADLVAAHEPDEVRFVLPARDQLPYLARLIERLPIPARVISIEPPWRE
ncbi:MAG: hypothetical protein AAGA37_10810 [Actinomycetota bacterium]